MVWPTNRVLEAYRKGLEQLLNNQNLKLGRWALFICSFADASIFPAPVLTIFILLVLLNYRRAGNYVALATLGTFSGALAGYFLGYATSVNLNFGSAGFLQFLNNHVSGLSEDGFHRIQLLYSKWNVWILFMASFSPIPYGLFSISSGIFKMSLPIYCLVTLICQATKFWFLAIVTKKIVTSVLLTFLDSEAEELTGSSPH